MRGFASDTLAELRNRLYCALMLFAPMSLNRALHQRSTGFRAWWGPM